MRETLANEVALRANGARFVPAADEGPLSLEYRRHVNSQGSPSEQVARGYRWTPGTELSEGAIEHSLVGVRK